MASINAASLVNLLGFLVGLLLYGMLAAMVWRRGSVDENPVVRRLLFATAFLGLTWNLGELILVGQRDLGAQAGDPWLIAASYCALGFLPSVVVHSALIGLRSSRAIIFTSYLLSSTAGLLHIYGALSGATAPSGFALRLLTGGSIVLVIVLAVIFRNESKESRVLWVAALLIFAVSTFHLSSHGDESSFFIELIAHQSSLPLAIVILLQNYRFAFADLFLKRALALILLASVAFAAYFAIARPLVTFHDTHGPDDIFSIAIILVLWIATAISFPWIDRFAKLVVDRLMLHRPNFLELQNQMTSRINSSDTIDLVLSRVSEQLGKSFTAREIEWVELGSRSLATSLTRISKERDSAELLIAPNEEPHYAMRLGAFDGGRRLLSEEIALLDSVALATARRIDAIRVTHERCEQELREQEFEKLTTEAQLAALRAQINPHFLFNTLNTIGYLIQTTPEKAIETLLKLTKMLRRVLSTGDEFSTLREEIELVSNYLEIEQARFEERLQIRMNIDKDLHKERIPRFILQPIVENAVRHAISEHPNGGVIEFTAQKVTKNVGKVLRIEVRDSGSGKANGTSDGTGLGIENVRSRLRTLFKENAELRLSLDTVSGTTAVLTIPISENLN